MQKEISHETEELYEEFTIEEIEEKLDLVGYGSFDSGRLRG